jgi:hypothetical protein
MENYRTLGLKMKETFIVLSVLALILSACSTSQKTDETAIIQEATAIANIVSATKTALAPLPTLVSTEASSSGLTTDYENASPVSMQILIGITQLENTDHAITSTQAESFIAVLNFMKDLSMNTSATEEQFDALVEQAESILTGEQIQAIANLKITQETAMSLLQQGNSMGSHPQGEMTQGTPPGPGGQPPSADAIGTPPANGNPPTMRFIPPQLIDTLIQFLESKTASS